MFENHFGFIRRPFTAGPDVELFVNNETAQAAFESIDYCLRGGQGIAVLTAPSGTGKSMLCQVLIGELRDEFHFSFLPSPGTSSRLGLLQAIYFGLGKRVKRRHAGISDSEMRLELIDAVRSLRVRSTGLALLIDEAHLLDNEQLEEIRILSNFADRGQPLIRPLLCGAPSLEERLLDPELKALSQRIRCQVYLEPLSRDESELFIHHQLTRAGVQNRHIFEPGALQKIVQAADGNARCLNQLCDEALHLAAKESERTVTDAIVETALDTLVQLPLSWNRSLTASRPTTSSSDGANAAAHQAGSPAATSDSSTESVIEFGSLEDDFDAEPAIEIGSDVGVAAVNEPVVADSWESDETSVSIEFSEPPVSGNANQLPPTVVVAPAETEDYVESHDDEILVDEPVFEVGADRDDYSEELTETFRQGLPEAPVPFHQQSVDRYGIAESNEADVVLPSEDFVELKPRFDGAVAQEDLLPQSHASGSRSKLMRSAQTVGFGEKSKQVEDQWSESVVAEQPDVVSGETVASAEEELLQSCINTRRDIATMLDSLESHVSESLADRYDIVMPELEASSESPQLDSQTSERFDRVIDTQRMH
ncbi:MAG: ExeA family protein [Planctomycetaceae bacterium]